MTTITGDGDVPHLEEDVGNAKLQLVCIFSYLLLSLWSLHTIFLLSSQLFPFFSDVVAAIVSDKFVVLNLFGNVVVVDALVEFTSFTVVPVVVAFLKINVPLFSVEVVVKDIVVDHLFCESLLDELAADDVDFDVPLPIVLLDVEHNIVVDLFKTIILM